MGGTLSWRWCAVLPLLLAATFGGRAAASDASPQSEGVAVSEERAVSDSKSTHPRANSTAPSAADPEVRAKHHFEQGQRAYASQRYGEAAWHFARADALRPSPELVFNVALAYDKLRDTSAALRHYREYLERAPGGARAALVEERVEVLQSVLAARGVQQLMVRTQPRGARIEVNGMLVGVTPWSGELPPGSHEVRLTRSGYQPQSLSIELGIERATTVERVLVARSRTEPEAPASPLPEVPEPGVRTPAAGEVELRARAKLHPVSAKPPEPVREQTAPGVHSPLRPWAWATLIAAGTAGATAGGFELARSRAERDARQASGPREWARDVERMEQRQRAARISLGVAGGMLLTSGLLWWLSRSHAEPEEAPVVTCGTTGCLGTWVF